MDIDWAVDDFWEASYLDGIKFRYMVYAGGSRRAPIGYFFQQDAAQLAASAPDLLAALKTFLEKYVEMVDSGDCGFWDPETEEKVIAARAAIAKATV